MSYWFQFTLVFFSVFIADISWAMYFYKISQGKSIAAGIWGSVVTILGAYTISEYVHDPTFIIAAALGGGIGTIVTVEYNKRKMK